MKAFEYSNNDYYHSLDDTLLLMDHTNSRIRILKHDSLDSNQLQHIKELARINNLGKIISFTPIAYQNIFNTAGFVVEGKIAGFFQGSDALCYSYFVDEARSISEVEDVKATLLESPTDVAPLELVHKQSAIKVQPPFEVADAIEAEIIQMTKLFQSVFSTYPSPVFDQEYIRNNMKTNKVVYKVALHYGKVIGIASAELDSENRNAEMTDCVTMPDYRGQGILTAILQALETQLQNSSYSCLYSLSRAVNPSINKAFKRQGYSYSGRMINNCHMCGHLEDMNIWVKQLV